MWVLGGLGLLNNYSTLYLHFAPAQAKQKGTRGALCTKQNARKATAVAVALDGWHL